MYENAQVSVADLTEPPTPRPGTVHAGDAVRHPVDIGSHQLGVALTWVRRGCPVIPCSKTDKGALVPGFGKDRSSEDMAHFADPQQVESWWTGRYRRAHVGLLTGRGDRGGLVVVDLDMSKTGQPLTDGRWAGCMHGTDILERLMADAGAEWPETYSVLTPSGGMHLYFEQPQDGGPLIGCATGDGKRAPHIGPMVDVRGIGGYVIAAGSYSAAQGRPYTWVTTSPAQPQPLPGWLLALLRPAEPPEQTRPPAPVVRALPSGDRAERYAAAALRGQAQTVAAATEGGRWRTLTAATLRLAELADTAPHVLTAAVVEEALLDASAACGMPTLEAARAIRSAWNNRTGHGHRAGAA